MGLSKVLAEPLCYAKHPLTGLQLRYLNLDQSVKQTFDTNDYKLGLTSLK